MAPSFGPHRRSDLICLSHLRWNFVFQRPQHLMTRCARDRRVFFVEEPLYRSGIAAQLQIESSGSVRVVTPLLPEGLSSAEIDAAQRALLDELIETQNITDYVL